MTSDEKQAAETLTRIVTTKVKRGEKKGSSIPDLRAQAKARGIRGFTHMSKDELMYALSGEGPSNTLLNLLEPFVGNIMTMAVGSLRLKRIGTSAQEVLVQKTFRCMHLLTHRARTFEDLACNVNRFESGDHVKDHDVRESLSWYVNRFRPEDRPMQTVLEFARKLYTENGGSNPRMQHMKRVLTVALIRVVKETFPHLDEGLVVALLSILRAQVGLVGERVHAVLCEDPNFSKKKYTITKTILETAGVEDDDVRSFLA